MKTMWTDGESVLCTDDLIDLLYAKGELAEEWAEWMSEYGNAMCAHLVLVERKDWRMADKELVAEFKADLRGRVEKMKEFSCYERTYDFNPARLVIEYVAGNAADSLACGYGPGEKADPGSDEVKDAVQASIHTWIECEKKDLNSFRDAIAKMAAEIVNKERYHDIHRRQRVQDIG